MGVPHSVLAVVLLTSSVHAAEPWEGAPFTGDPAAILRAAAAGPRPTAPVEILLDEAKAAFDAEGRRTLFWRRVYRVLDAKAAGKMYETAWAHWSPWFQDRPELRARVIGPGGSVTELDPRTISESPVTQMEKDLYSDSKLLVAPLPGFVDGAVVERLLRSVDRTPEFRSGFGRELELREPAPMRRVRLEVRAPRSLPVQHSLFGLNAPIQVREEGDQRIITLETGPLTGLELDEPNLARGQPPGPWFGYTVGRSWQAAAKEYADVVTQAIGRGDLGTEARRVIGDAKTNEAAVDRLLLWMKDLRYSGVELGDAAYVPRSPGETLSRGYGDCKDLATLMVAMLRAAGRPASVALLRVTGRDVAEDLPTLAAFDHAIVRVGGPKPLWVDPTQPLLRAGILPWTDQGRFALVADARTTRLERIPTFPSTQNSDQATIEIALTDSGMGSIKSSHEGQGWIATWMHEIRRGDPKERRAATERWFQRQQSVERVTAYEETGCTPGDPCRLTVAGVESKRALTGDFDAAAFLDPFAPFEDLPDALKVDEDKPGGKPRTLPLELPPVITEVRYHVIPPAGFQPRGKPSVLSQQIGPAIYGAAIERLPDGSVNATFRLDTVKSVYTAAEVTAFRKALHALRLEGYTRVIFDSEVALLAQEGKTREALERARALVKAQPTVGAHQARLARTLVEAGFGKTAREVAKKGTEIAPKDPVVWRALAFTYEHDALGRRFHPGFDRDSAISAYRKAKDLKREVSTVSALAWVLERDVEGERWAPGARLDEAVSEYRTLGEIQKSHEADPYVLADLYYAGKIDEVLVRAPEAPQSAFRDQIWTAALAVGKGVPAALAKAEQLTSSDENKRKLVLQSVPHLLRRKFYAQASALFQVGQGTQADAQNRLALTVFPRLKPRPQWGIPPGDPRTTLIRVVELGQKREPSKEELRSLFAAEALEGVKPEALESITRTFTGLASPIRALQLPAEVTLDFVVASTDWAMKGDAKTGWYARATSLGAGDKRVHLFAIREGEEIRTLGISPGLGAVGLRALRQIDRGEKSQARQWLSWAREAVGELPSGGGEVWLSYMELSRAEQLVSDEGLRTAATVLALHGPGSVPLDAVRAAREKAGAGSLANSLDLALAYHLGQREQWAEQLEVAERLLKAQPSSVGPFLYRINSLTKLGRAEEAEKVARERAADLPGDDWAARMLMATLTQRGKIQAASAVAQERVDSGRGGPQDYNELAWNQLALGLADANAYEAARRASQLTGGKDWMLLNTHAAVSAATGHPEEGRKLLLETLAVRGDERLVSSDWLVVGLIAEQYGLTEEARSAYQKSVDVDESKKSDIGPTSASKIARSRMAKPSVAPAR